MVLERFSSRTVLLVLVASVVPGGTCGGAGATGPAPGQAGAYDAAVLADHPVAYWALDPRSDTEPDLSGHGAAGSYRGGVPAPAPMPNGDTAADFDGATQYVTIPARATFSVPTTGSLTWEVWLRPDALDFPHATSDGFVAFLGKCAHYAPSCEWEGRMYSATNAQGRCDRVSAYAFNPGAGLGSGAFWQPACGIVQAGAWLHVVGEYTLRSQPAGCPSAASYPGSIDIWVNGVKWGQAAHNPTGCMGQYAVAPRAGDSPVNIGSMALDSWFAGAIGKVAIYDYQLGADRIVAHYRAMTGEAGQGQGQRQGQGQVQGQGRGQTNARAAALAGR